MATELETWALTEREFLREEIRYFQAGAIVTSPSGENITARKVAELEARLEHVIKALDGQYYAEGIHAEGVPRQ
jgi:hypothetical protein